MSLRGKRQQLQESLAELNSSELLEELQTTQKQLENTISEYRQAVNTEIEQARQIRMIAVERAREQAKQNIDSVEKKLNFLEKEIETATDKLDQILTKETEFRNRYLIIYPTLVLLIFIAFVVLLGIFSQSILWLLLKYFWGNLVNYLLWIFIAVLTYLGTIWIKYSSTIREPIQQIKKRIKSLESSLKANAVELRRSYNEQLKLEYDLYAQNLRIETLNYLIKTAKQYGENLRQTMSNFSQIHNDLLTQREQANTYLLRLANINAPACKQDNLWLTLIANKIALRLKIIANRLKIIATSLQSSSSAQINCK